MASKSLLLVGLLFAIVLLISSHDVIAAREAPLTKGDAMDEDHHHHHHHCRGHHCDHDDMDQEDEHEEDHEDGHYKHKCKHWPYC